VKAIGAENIVPTPCILEVLTNKLLLLFATMMEISEDVIPLYHTSEDGVTPSLLTSLLNVDLFITKDQVVPSIPNVPDQRRF